VDDSWKYKFELLRSDAAEQIMTAHSVRVSSSTPEAVVECFTAFLEASGFERARILDAYQRLSDEV
jgi:S-methylmethionine-dependent homocysteine/selenocysteine methylase